MDEFELEISQACSSYQSLASSEGSEIQLDAGNLNRKTFDNFKDQNCLKEPIKDFKFKAEKDVRLNLAPEMGNLNPAFKSFQSHQISKTLPSAKQTQIAVLPGSLPAIATDNDHISSRLAILDDPFADRFEQWKTIVDITEVVNTITILSVSSSSRH